ncbi:hypothetical protein [Kribbella sp. NPDC048915]|uniref:hypothetical protein n=1 Tax=Kribbella sp. NPDC048915 TaxID=3155148 RepID=UPI0034090D32
MNTGSGGGSTTELPACTGCATTVRRSSGCFHTTANNTSSTTINTTAAQAGNPTTNETTYSTRTIAAAVRSEFR